MAKLDLIKFMSLNFSAYRHNQPTHFHFNRRIKVGILGGSFNPAHKGHLHISEVAKKKLNLEEIIIPEISIIECLEKVFSLPQVGSKDFLVHKVDRSVSGLIVQQQCVGPFGLPISDYSAVSSSIFSDKGSVMAIGEQPIKSFISSELMVEYTVSEMLSNIIWGGVESLSSIKCSGNWMWAPKVDGEGGHLIDAVKQLSNILIKLL